jgi:hypothetical protein
MSPFSAIRVWQTANRVGEATLWQMDGRRWLEATRKSWRHTNCRARAWLQVESAKKSDDGLFGERRGSAEV